LTFSLEICADQDVTLVYCRGRIVYGAESTALSQKVAELVPRSRRLVLDLSQVESIDSAGLGELVLLYLWAQASGCSIKLSRLPAHISRLLELTNLASVFEVHPSVESAVCAARAQVA
jgi:anti-sigma B factor antagonist